MRFTEIASSEDQLALWKLVSDKMWAAFGQQKSPQSNPVQSPQLVTLSPNATAKPIVRSPANPVGKRKVIHVKAQKPKKAPMAPAPKPLPKPKPQQLTQTQAAKQQSQQHQQIAQHIHKEIAKANPQKKIYPQQPTSIQQPVTPVEPMTNGYDERDRDELVMHSRSQHPFKTVSQIKSAFTGQKQGL
jgi:hypothetical protein